MYVPTPGREAVADGPGCSNASPAREQAIDNSRGMPAPDMHSRLLTILAADVAGFRG